MWDRVEYKWDEVVYNGETFKCIHVAINPLVSLLYTTSSIRSIREIWLLNSYYVNR